MKYLVLFLLLAMPAWAVNPDEMLKDPKQEQRARDLGRELRCLVCQNQSIDDSDAELARDLRVLVRERIQKGDNDEAVMQFLIDRYGDFVTLKPPVKPATYLLWFGPPVLFVLSFFSALMYYRRRKEDRPQQDLSPEEERKFKKLLESGDK